MLDSVSPWYGCGTPIPNPISGMFLNQLPGIEFANIAGIADADEVTASGVWNDIQATAKSIFRDDVIAEFGNKYLLRQITQTVDLGKGINTTSLTAPVGGTTNGMLMETIIPQAQCACSNLLEIYVQSIQFYWYGTDPNPTFTVNFQDADQLNIEYTVTVANAVPGWNYVWIDKSFNARRLYMLATGNFDDYVDLDISNFNLSNFGGSLYGTQGNSWIYYNYAGCGCQARLQGCQYTTAGNQYVVGPNTFGLSAIFSAKCSWDNVVCANKRHFFTSWQLCLAIQYLNFRINTSRLNRWTTTDLEQAIKLRDLYDLQYRGGIEKGTETNPIRLDYPGKLRTAIQSLTMNDQDCCLKSNNYLIWREIIT
jgi:hypothetical protein